MKLLRPIDVFLNSITMYRLTLYFLIVLIVIAVLFGSLGVFPHDAFDILLSTGIIVITAYVSNYLFAKLFHAITNVESVFITALILVLIVPFSYPHSIPYAIAVAILAMAVKYLVVVEKQHLLNPAAAAVAAIALLSPVNSATWWVGTPVMVPFIIIGGLGVVRKIRREDMVITFFAVYAALVLVFGFIHGGTAMSAVSVLRKGMFESSLFFFAFVMFTEPITSPPTRKLQRYYAVLVALLYATPQIRLFGIAFTPEIALCLGNFFSFFTGPKYRLVLTLQEKIKLTEDVLSFVFRKNGSFSFTPGQYMEWTLPHKNADSRGNRRYFSLASSPTEANPMITVKLYNPSSSYKSVLRDMEIGGKITASQLMGDFTLPKKSKTPLVFIAGGVGIAPFRSMIQYIVDEKLSSDIILLFANRHKEDIIFQDLFARAESLGVKTIQILTDRKSVPKDWKGQVGYITVDMIRETVPDFKNRIFYISGPQLMVQQTQMILADLGIPLRHIKTDFFPGYKENK